MAKVRRKFTDHEASLILKRAGELSAQESVGDRSTSLDELESAAEEAGIDRALVRRAANELQHAPVTAPRDNAFLGGPTSIVIEAVVDGELPGSAHEHVVALIRRRTSQQGEHDVLGRTLTWTTGARYPNQMVRRLMVTVSVRGGATTIRVEENLGQLAGALFGGILGGVGGGGIGMFIAPLIVAGIPALIPVALVAWLGGIYGVTRKIFSSKARSRHKELRELLQGLVVLCEESMGGPSGALPEGASSAALSEGQPPHPRPAQ